MKWLALLLSRYLCFVAFKGYPKKGGSSFESLPLFCGFKGKPPKKGCPKKDRIEMDPSLFFSFLCVHLNQPETRIASGQQPESFSKRLLMSMAVGGRVNGRASQRRILFSIVNWATQIGSLVGFPSKSFDRVLFILELPKKGPAFAPWSKDLLGVRHEVPGFLDLGRADHGRVVTRRWCSATTATGAF